MDGSSPRRVITLHHWGRRPPAPLAFRRIARCGLPPCSTGVNLPPSPQAPPRTLTLLWEPCELTTLGPSRELTSLGFLRGLSPPVLSTK